MAKWPRTGDIEAPMKPAKTSKQAIAALLVVTIIWGWTFVWMKEALQTSEAQLGSRGMVAAVGLFMMVRFGMAAVFLPIVVPAARKGLSTKQAWVDGAWLAAILLSAFLLQMFGLQGVSPAVSAFLTSLYVAFTAILSRFNSQTRISRALVFGVFMATVGSGFISGPPQLHFDLPEWLTVFCALLFAVHILATDVITRRTSPALVSLTTFAWVTVGGALTLGIGISLDPSIDTSALTTLLLTPGFYKPACLTSLLGTLVALSLLNQFQRELDPVRAAILYALEPVWASLIALSIGMGTIDSWLIFGGGALILGNLVAELGAGGQDGKDSEPESPKPEAPRVSER